MEEKKEKRVLKIELDEDELDQATGGSVGPCMAVNCHPRCNANTY